MTPVQITAKIIAYSRCKRTGKKILTVELEYPRFIHGELMTHRLFSRNAASSRAIPVKKVIEQVRTNPAMPIHFGANQAGMQAKNELSDVMKKVAIWLWKQAAKSAASAAEGFEAIGLHKQVTNRILEPFQLMKTVVTATDWENFFWLRDHADAQPEIEALAQAILKAIEEYGMPEDLEPGEWHTPYVFHHRDSGGVLQYIGDELQYYTLEEALAVSSSCCAQVSFRLLNTDLDKAEDIYDKLVNSEPVHASPFEHQATPIAKTVEEHDVFTDDNPINDHSAFDTWQEGITHVDRDGKFWSGNFCGWVQHRQLINNNVKRG